ncbi:hypothetical protein CMV_000531 [Castanea mollissima]|uniref:Uncharacterized protein n=1 Tax=Castanea mollissima TaxID=60419 RepID=A0A8J4VYZ0_9ROSI|nr:hypothetical protein CMV_000531 [Castanea mollissima]
MRLQFKQLFGGITLLNSLTTPQSRGYARDLFPNKISHYLYRAKLIDSIRLGLRSNPPSPISLAPILNDRLLDSFVVTQALRSALSADSALSLVETLETTPYFSHTQNTLHALATVLAKSCWSVQLKCWIYPRTDEFLKEMSPDERIKNIGCSVDSSDDDEGNEVSHASGIDDVNGVQLNHG